MRPFAQRKVRALSAVESAWLGAMIEGEGSVLLRDTNRSNSILQGLVQVVNTEVETLATCLRLVGAGAVYLRPDGQKDTYEHTKPVWFWVLTAQRDVVALLEAIRPYLTGKQDRADVVLRYVRNRLGS